MATDHVGCDSVDVPPSRKTRQLVATKADFLDNFIAVIAIATYFADIVTDILVAREYHNKQQWEYFGLTVTFVTLPSLMMMLFSCKWHQDDKGGQSCYSIIVHLLQLAPIERYCMAWWCGVKTWCLNSVKKEDYERYLNSWRDVTMLRIIETFMESAPQLVLQLYILTELDRPVDLKHDLWTVGSAAMSVVSIAWSIVSYSNQLRLCTRDTGLPIFGYAFQVLYRLSMIASRVFAMVLFASQYHHFLFLVVLVHWIIMIVWLRSQKTNFCMSASEKRKVCYEITFVFVLAFVYNFCFLNAKEGSTRRRVTIFYVIFFVENSLMVAAWYPMRREVFGVLEYSALTVVWGAFFLGLLFMLLYYKFFHPNVNITAGWLCCCFGKKPIDKASHCSSSIDVENVNKYGTDVVGTPQLGKKPSKLGKKNTPTILSRNKYSISIEISPRISTSDDTRDKPYSPVRYADTENLQFETYSIVPNGSAFSHNSIRTSSTTYF